RYGAVVKGKLIPETVKYKDLEMGRFEVTRSQFAEYDAKYEFEAGKENYPATNISFDQAKKYAAWLSRLTGESFRLPDEEEADVLYSAAGPSENTLDHWAGYSVNPDDAARLVPLIRELPTAAPLIKEVGSFKA